MPQKKMTRRQFAATAAATVTAAALTSTRAFAQDTSTLRAAWVGTGGRGFKAADSFLTGCKGTELVALADVLPDRIKQARKWLEHKKFEGRVKVADGDCYVGFDAIDKVCARDDVDIIIHSTPPGFRPYHALKAVKASKHLFLEKPGGVDAVGLRKLIEASDIAAQKGLSIVAGTQQRRMEQYIEMMKRVREDGAIGDVVAAESVWHSSNIHWHFHKRQDDWSDMEWQIRCWPFFTWLSGDHVVEQHVHNLDVARWALGELPKTVQARGGRIARTGEEYGNIFDHFAGTFEYDDDRLLYSAASQIKGATAQVYDRIIGCKGVAWVNRGTAYITGENEWKFSGKHCNPDVRQQQDLIDAIRSNKPINEGRQLAESTFMAVAERISAYTGRKLNLNWVINASKQDLMPPAEKLKMDAELPVGPVPVPGKTRPV